MTARTAARLAALGGALAVTALVAPPYGSARAWTVKQANYTLLGRAYAVSFGYPADEVPSTGEEEAPPSPPPDVTCTERGVDFPTQERIDRALADAVAVSPRVTDAPSIPRGQPIRFNVGLADNSLRSDPGAHSIASFFYVDLGGTQDPWTDAETDGYASGHARERERCARPRATAPGTADDVHVISRAIPGPYTYAFNQFRRYRGEQYTVQESVTYAEMDGRGPAATAKVASLVAGIRIASITIESVTSAITYETSGTDATTVLKAQVAASGVDAYGRRLDLRPGAPPIAVGNLLVGLAAPEVRRRADGALEVEVGGLYVGIEAPNPAGLQAKQAIFFGGSQLTAGVNQTDVEVPGIPIPVPIPSEPAPRPAPRPVAPPPAVPVAPATTPAPAPTVAPPVAVPPPAVTRTLGVYRRTAAPAGPVALGATAALALLVGGYGWARHRLPVDRAALRWLDHCYRAFVRG